MTSSQQASWETNAYVVATTRVFVGFGLAYMVKISYQVYRRLRTPNDITLIQDRVIGAEEANIGFELALNGFSSGAAAAFDLENVTDVGELVGVRRPLPVYCPGSPIPQ